MEGKVGAKTTGMEGHRVRRCCPKGGGREKNARALRARQRADYWAPARPWPCAPIWSRVHRLMRGARGRQFVQFAGLVVQLHLKRAGRLTARSHSTEAGEQNHAAKQCDQAQGGHDDNKREHCHDVCEKHTGSSDSRRADETRLSPAFLAGGHVWTCGT